MRRAAIVLGVALTAVLFAPSAHADGTASGTRIAGPDRIATAIAISHVAFPNGGAKGVVLARSDNFADALAGAPFAVQDFAPVLLTNSSSLDPRDDAEIKRVLAPGSTIYVLGLQGAISDSVTAALTAEGYTVTRVGGPDRFSTAIAIDQLITSPKTIVVADGMNFPDALSAGAAAASTGGVVVLTNGTTMPVASQAYLTQNPTLPQYAVGGAAAQAAAGPTVVPLVGADRYQTAVLVAQKLFSQPVVVGIASGEVYPDGLAGGPAVAIHHGPLLLVQAAGLPQVVHDYLVSVSSTLTNAEVFGGTDVIPDGELAAIDSAIRGT